MLGCRRSGRRPRTSGPACAGHHAANHVRERLVGIVLGEGVVALISHARKTGPSSSTEMSGHYLGLSGIACPGASSRPTMRAQPLDNRHVRPSSPSLLRRWRACTVATTAAPAAAPAARPSMNEPRWRRRSQPSMSRRLITAAPLGRSGSGLRVQGPQHVPGLPRRLRCPDARPPAAPSVQRPAGAAGRS